MSKYQKFEDLQELGSEKIHEKTHISRDKIELVLTKSYGELGKVQFMGFISILEREYNLDLNDIREEYTAFWNEHKPSVSQQSSSILQAKSNSKQKWIVAGMAAAALLIVGGYLLQSSLSNAPREELIVLSSLHVETAETEEANGSAEANQSAEGNLSVVAAPIAAEQNTSVPAKGDALPSGQIRIVPKYKVWVGMIDTAKGTKTQQITSDPIVVDGSAALLIVLGHGMVEIESAAGKETVKERNTLRLAVENGTFRRLSQNEFQGLNNGKNW